MNYLLLKYTKSGNVRQVKVRTWHTMKNACLRFETLIININTDLLAKITDLIEHK